MSFLVPTSLGNGCVATQITSRTSWHFNEPPLTANRSCWHSASDGGCNFAIAPTLNATQTTVTWSPELDTSAVLLTSTPTIAPTDRNLSRLLDQARAETDEFGSFFHHVLPDGDAIQVLRLASVGADEPLSALIPLDPDALDRLEALLRLVQSLLGRRVAEDTRLTHQKRRRARHMLQAVDGRVNGASYREIGSVIYGRERVASEPWKTSALRDATIDLVKDGLAMIAGGYRNLLRHRRRR